MPRVAGFRFQASIYFDSEEALIEFENKFQEMLKTRKNQSSLFKEIINNQYELEKGNK